MPFDAMVMSAVVVGIFCVFIGAIAWGDYQTRPENLKKADPFAVNNKKGMENHAQAVGGTVMTMPIAYLFGLTGLLGMPVTRFVGT